ncbi:MAG TPA: hypothetical protein VFJ12_06490 [Segeticoccus sp.]|nr:hypothetical protein [Segeticoccus sp.]
MNGLVFDVVQIVGALLVLVCFLLAQADRVNAAGYRYLVANLVGSGAMTVTAVIAHEWGFVFLEGIWALVSAWGVTQRLRGVDPRAVH